VIRERNSLTWPNEFNFATPAARRSKVSSKLSRRESLPGRVYQPFFRVCCIRPGDKRGEEILAGHCSTKISIDQHILAQPFDVKLQPLTLDKPGGRRGRTKRLRETERVLQRLFITRAYPGDERADAPFFPLDSPDKP